jgi:predicted MFS family arabinose efflux permease
MSDAINAGLVARPGAASRPGAVAAAIVLSVAGVAAFSVLPLIVGAIADRPGSSAASAGYVAAADLLGFAATSVAAVFWVGRVTGARAAAAGLALLVTGNLLSLGTPDLTMLLGARLLAGAGAGAVYAVAMSVLARAANADRAFGLMVAAQVGFQVVALYALSQFGALWGANAPFAALAVIAALAAPGILRLPGPTRDTAPGPSLLPRSRQGQYALAGVALFGVNIAAVWAYIERIGVGAGVPAAGVGRVLAAALAVSILGALGASWLRNRLGHRLPFTAAAVVQIAALALLSRPPTVTVFTIGAVLYFVAWAFLVPYSYSIVASRDDSGRLIVMAPAAQALGASLGPTLAAPMVRADSYLPVNGLAATALLGALLCVLAATHGATRSTTPEA